LKKKVAVVAGTVLLLPLIITGMPNADAGIVATDCSGFGPGYQPINDLNGNFAGCIQVNQNSTVPPTPFSPNMDVVVTTCAVHRTLTVVDNLGIGLNGPPQLLSPSATIFPHTGTFPQTIPQFNCTSYTGTIHFSGFGLPMEPGGWVYQSDVQVAECDCIITVVAFFDIDFFVLPESPIGALALIGSSLGALGTFAVIRRNRLKP
jgi:hypothetical protein